ncbi:thioredoxin domain-containing protein [Cryobacterium tepidiphilum]|uniref:Thioredoxin domain-containing protein n=1 Tax=Cryobacterium tepidiphilum TaxID=2486026 RepID=A0A3M8LEZ7_9MICO|nr:thioredoxin domain-containing protein [Cryobacterium tepidiphilum]RNE64107.1 thioredoxin domain-containing protein [Cryobacterium tepidiphilum]
MNRLSDAISPYLRSHADNPVEWYAWGPEAFAEAKARDVPVLVSIGYATCHWCHVMARESFSDPGLAASLNERFVSIKVDREEHPDVDASYLAAASAFTQNLGWPLNVFVTPEGKAFFAGTYSPPQPIPGHPSFGQVLDAVSDAWATRRDAVLETADQVGAALAAAVSARDDGNGLPGEAAFADARGTLAGYEDTTYGGFGTAPKFPVAPVLGFLLASADSRPLALRTLKRMGASPLRDPVEGGFFRYAVHRDWSEPHYERMLYDNAQLLDLYTTAWQLTGDGWARTVAEGVARFLVERMQLVGGGFASAQDSESTVDGQRTEGGYYALSEEDRALETPPARDEKVLTGWNGLAIGALARAGFALGTPAFIAAAGTAADVLLERHRRPDGTLLRASVGGRTSSAPATLEDYGMFAAGLLELSLSAGEPRYASAARELVDSTMTPGQDAAFTVPGGADPVLAAQGIALGADPSEGAYPSGVTATADAAHLLYLLTGDRRYVDAASRALGPVASLAPERPIAFGGALRLMAALASPVQQLVVVSTAMPAGDAGASATGASVLDQARRAQAGIVASVTDEQADAFAAAGFGLFAERRSREGRPTAYLCHDFVCRLPLTDAEELVRALRES